MLSLRNENHITMFIHILPEYECSKMECEKGSNLFKVLSITCRHSSWGTGGPDPSFGKPQVAKGFLRNTGTDLPLRSNMTPWVLLLLKGGSYNPL